MPSSNDDLLGTLRAVAQDQPTIRGELRVDHMGPEGRIAGKVYAFASSGGRFRLEAVSPLDTPLQTAAVDGDTFSLVDQENHRCVLGPAEPCLVADAVGMELSASHVAGVLIGAVPIIEHSSVTSEWNRCGYFEVNLQGAQEGWREQIRLSPVQGQLVPTAAEISGPEGTILEMELEGHAPAGDGDRLVPRHIVIRMPQNDTDLRVEWRELEVGVDLPANAWRVTCPNGFSAEQAGCESRSDMPTFEEPVVTEPEPPEDPGEECPPGEECSPDEEGTGEEGNGETDLSEELGLGG